VSGLGTLVQQIGWGAFVIGFGGFFVLVAISSVAIARQQPPPARFPMLAYYLRIVGIVGLAGVLVGSGLNGALPVWMLIAAAVVSLLAGGTWLARLRRTGRPS
jgi:hypothetical protein